MGAVVSREQRDAAAKNRQIERQLLRDRVAKPLKLLLLGPGESGKSTVLKQLRILHTEGFSKLEIEQRRSVVYSNATMSMAVVLEAMNELNISLRDTTLEQNARIVFDWIASGNSNEPFSTEVFDSLTRLWADEGVQQCFLQRNEYHLNDTAKYFFENLERIGAAGYTPSTQDILCTRSPTSGVVEVQFKMRGQDFRVFDVGGQRSERRKWIHCFDDVDALIFVTSLSEFDQTLREEGETNRMRESISLFKAICNSLWFLETSIILFLNKKDVLAEKLRISSITIALPDYTGPQKYEESVQFIRQKYLEQNLNRNKTIYAHETCATDTEQVQKIINSTLDIVLQQSMSRTGI